MRQLQKIDYQEERFYFTLVQKAGGWGKYQFTLFGILSAASILESSLIFIPPYLFYQSAFQCDGVNGEACSTFVCSLPSSQRAAYVGRADFNSIADDFRKDFRCEFKDLITLLISLIFVAGMSGLIIFSQFSESLGRRKSIIFSSFSLLLGIIITLLSGYCDSIWMLVLGIMFTYWGSQNAYQSSYCIATEAVSQNHRTLFISGLNMFYGVGMIINALAFRLTKDWALVYGCIFGFLALLMLIGATFFMEQTLINLLATQNEGEIIVSLQRIAKFNNVNLSLSKEQVSELKIKYLQIIKASSSKSFQTLDLFRYPSLRKIIFTLFPLNFIVSYLFLAPAIVNPSVDIYKQSMISGVTQMVSVFFSFLLSFSSRRRANFFLMTLFLIICFLLLIQDYSQSPLYYVQYFLLRLLLSLIYNILFLINNEMFPTQIRAAGTGLIVGMSFLAGIVQPYINKMWSRNHWSIMWTFIIVALISFIPIGFMKETHGVPPPEIIEQLAGSDMKEENRDI